MNYYPFYSIYQKYKNVNKAISVALYSFKKTSMGCPTNTVSSYSVLIPTHGFTYLWRC